MAGIQYAGEFTLDKCDLITASGDKVDIKALAGGVAQNLTTDFNLFELHRRQVFLRKCFLVINFSQLLGFHVMKSFGSKSSILTTSLS